MKVRILRDCFCQGRYYAKGTTDDVSDDWPEKYPKNFQSLEGVAPIKPVEEKLTYKSIAAAQTNFTSDAGKDTAPVVKPAPAAPQEEIEPVVDGEPTLDGKELDWDNAETYVSDKTAKEKTTKKKK